ncbi:MATE family efflux transporter [Bacteroides eggerthii]|uniref:MATE family efflux transporter n=2 Tax=Bacteroidales TaxID=171549 RepID=A0ABT7U482_9BACE|nr:MATE family efflux transporter [Bacteroides eggerthii]
MTELTKGNLTEGSITGTMLRFAWPLMLGNLLQQCYNIADTLIVGRVLGAEALAAVGSSYTLMIFITSIFIGLCMGCSAVFSMQYGAGDLKALRQSIYSSILLVGGTTLLLNAVSLIWLSPIIRLLQTPAEIVDLIYRYLFIILLGMIPVGIYNF